MAGGQHYADAAVDAPQPEDRNGVVRDYSVLVQAELARGWAREDDGLAAMARYALSAPGKMFRPVLLLESAQAVGGSAGDVLPAAAGTECGHVASLIHDDIIDGDELRRGQPAVYRRYGTDNAIVTGDALIFQLFLCLAECRHNGVPGERVAAALEVVAAAGVELCRGQVLEAEMTSAFVLDIDAYLAMISMKTAALFQGACECGAILAGAPPEWVRALGEYGRAMGVAFQVRDDTLGYVGDDAVVGKPASSDIRNRRLTFPLIHAFEHADAAGVAVLTAALDGGVPAERAVDAVGEVLRRTGSIEAAERFAHEHAGKARDALSVLPPSPSRERLEGFALRAVNRVH
ncbi:polyprenyl synthetase family protein [Actinomadura parmotrematis]|uniref:Polyprenyl synthetase family protein n=1 Tax=Actinomadura parmotrematis TaxID=2864039 RepID=A0ABS7G2K7_9ACTN|nr:polyprenyl synthetase family protein [Actinomadura parmotrematis]MBW8486450.1 polyprenyl synthetase family protein [Actinomadura parmotrematis]